MHLWTRARPPLLAVGRLFGALVAFMAAPIGFREILLFAGAALLGTGASMIYYPAGFIAAGLAIAGVAIFGVRVP